MSAAVGQEKSVRLDSRRKMALPEPTRHGSVNVDEFKILRLYSVVDAMTMKLPATRVSRGCAEGLQHLYVQVEDTEWGAGASAR